MFKKNQNANGDKEERDKILLPKFLHEYIRAETPRWAQSSFNALAMSDGAQYIQRNAKVIPVDNENSGIIEENTLLDAGLHQMLQIRHGLKITSLTLPSACNNNFNFLKPVKHLTAFTGTAGSEAERSFIERTFDIMSTVVPRFKERKFKQEEDLICESDEEWLRLIIEKVYLLP